MERGVFVYQEGICRVSIEKREGVLQEGQFLLDFREEKL
jgi:hypothetical protein